MGSCSSCLRRRKTHDPERDPLLPKHSHSAPKEQVPDPKNPLQKVTDILAGLKAGKLPSTAQVDQALRVLLRTGFLDAEQLGNGNGNGNENGNGEVGNDAKKVVNDVKELVESILVIGSEKNHDDRVQDLCYQLSKLPSAPVKVDAQVKVPGVVDELNAKIEGTHVSLPICDDVY